MLLRHASQYMISSVLTAALGFMSAAVFTRLLTPGDYGVYVVGFGLANFMSATLFTWVRYSVMRFESEGETADVRLTSLAAYLLSASLAPLILISAHFGAGMPWERATAAVMLSLGLSLFEMSQEILRSNLKVRMFVISSMVRSALAFGVCLVIAELGGGGLGQLAGGALAFFIASALSSREIWRGPRAPINRQKLKRFLWLGAAVTVTGFLVTLQISLDRLFIAWRFSDSAAGLYGASADLVKQIVLVPAGSVAAAAFPLMVRTFARGDAVETRKQLERTGELLIAVLAPAALGLALTAPYLASFLLGPAFRATAAAIMPILAFAWMFQSISQSYIHVSFHLSMRQGLSIPHSVAALAMNVAMLWPLTSRFGPVGAAWSLLISEFVGAVVGYVCTFWSHPLPLLLAPIRRVFLASGWMSVVVIALERLFPVYSAATFAILAVSGAFVYVIACLLLNVYETRAFAVTALGALVARAGKRMAPQGRGAS